MLSTDGYANCFGDDEGFFKVGADFLSYLRAEGSGFVGEKLEEWLRQSSQDGSGDDITVGLAARANAFPSFPRSQVALGNAIVPATSLLQTGSGSTASPTSAFPSATWERGKRT